MLKFRFYVCFSHGPPLPFQLMLAFVCLSGSNSNSNIDPRRLADQFGLTLDRQTSSQIESTVIRDPRPFHPQRLYEVCQNHLGTSLYRTKGYIWLASRPGDVLLWQQSGSQISFELTGVWAAEAVHNRYGKLLDVEVEMIQKQIDAAHPVFGDRHNTLTVIGLPHACKIFAEALEKAFCTEEFDHGNVDLTLSIHGLKAFALDTSTNDRLLLSWMGLHHCPTTHNTNKDKDGNVGICIQSVSRVHECEVTQSPLTPMLGMGRRGYGLDRWFTSSRVFSFDLFLANQSK